MNSRVLCFIAVSYLLASNGMNAHERAPADCPESAMSKSIVTSASYSHLTEAEIAPLRLPSSLRRLSLQDCPISEKCLDQICSLKELQFLSLPESRIEDAGLARLKELPKLKFLSLNQTGVTDKGLKHVGALKGLQTL